MTDEELTNLEGLLEAYKQEKEIQISLKGENKWEDCDLSRGINTITFDYRIKPEEKPEYRPFTNRDNISLLGRKIKYKQNEKSKAIITWENTTMSMILVGKEHISYQNLFDKYVFEDGSPCGVKLGD